MEIQQPLERRQIGTEIRLERSDRALHYALETDRHFPVSVLIGTRYFKALARISESARGVVNDKTRLLCMVGDCLAVAKAPQARGHVRGAMRNGASPREIMDI